MKIILELANTYDDKILMRRLKYFQFFLLRAHDFPI